MSGDYAPTVIDGQAHVWLQSFGWCPAKPLAEIAAGDTIVYNFGITASVVRVERSKSGASTTVTVASKDGSEYTGRARRSATLVAVRRSK